MDAYSLTASALLSVWERGLTQLPVQRSLSLLRAATAGARQGELSELPIGERDVRLVRLRAWLFGPSIVAVAQCPECRSQVELTVDTRALVAEPQQRVSDEHWLEADGHRVRFRLPNSSDLVAVDGSEPEDARNQLLARCVLQVEDESSRGELPGAVKRALQRQMEAIDPCADIQLKLDCPDCSTSWRERFDIGLFLWEEVNVWARSALSDVNILAQAYGWGEDEILGLSPARRQMYVAMVAG